MVTGNDHKIILGHDDSGSHNKHMCISQMHFCYIMIVFQKLYLVHLPTATTLSVSSTLEISGTR